VSGLLNLDTGLLFGALDLVELAVLGKVLGVLAVAGYGWTIARMGRAEGSSQTGQPVRI